MRQGGIEFDPRSINRNQIQYRSRSNLPRRLIQHIIPNTGGLQRSIRARLIIRRLVILLLSRSHHRIIPQIDPPVFRRTSRMLHGLSITTHKISRSLQKRNLLTSDKVIINDPPARINRIVLPSPRLVNSRPRKRHIRVQLSRLSKFPRQRLLNHSLNLSPRRQNRHLNTADTRRTLGRLTVNLVLVAVQYRRRISAAPIQIRLVRGYTRLQKHHDRFLTGHHRNLFRPKTSQITLAQQRPLIVGRSLLSNPRIHRRRNLGPVSPRSQARHTWLDPSRLQNNRHILVGTRRHIRI